MIEVHILTSVVVTCLALAFLYVIWSDDVYIEVGVSRRDEKILDAVLTTFVLFALTDLWGLI